METEIQAIESTLEDLIRTAERSRRLVDSIVKVGLLLRERLLAGSKVLTAGNGGSAADALHMAEELVGRFHKERRSLGAVCLSADPTLLTCIGNDYGFDRLFSRQMEGLGKPSDVLVIFSTSGNSQNLVQALKTAQTLGITSVAVLGKDGGQSKGLAEYEIIVPSSVTARIQEVHTFILHSWLEMIERNM